MSSATTTPAPALRRATLQDAEAVSALGSSVFSATFGHSVTPQQLQAYLDESYSVAATARDIEDTQKDMTGVGKLLIHEAQRQARGQGFEHMWLGVWEENHKAAQMYAKLGFSVVGEHEFDVGGDIQTDRIMLKKL
ncbi:Myosin regulatory light chain cdc4 [Verticillium dahliae VDG1]|nr:Myosin regulatory light chain cdc4 [Verticillium dahliae VDG1]